MLEKCRNTSAPCTKSQCCTSTVQCVCLFMLCVRAVRCVKAWLGPAASQEDRRGSRWTGLDLTLPTPFYPPGPPSLLIQPARHALQNESRAATECCAAPGGGGEPCLMLLVPRRDGQKTESNITLPCVSWAVLTHGPGLHVWTLGLLFSSAVSLQYYFFFLPPMMHSAVGPLSLALLACLLGKCQQNALSIRPYTFFLLPM